MRVAVVNAENTAFASEQSSGDIPIPKRELLAARNPEAKLGVFHKEYRYIDILDTLVDNLPFTGEFRREGITNQWIGNQGIRERIALKMGDGIIEKLRLKNEPKEVKISLGFDIRHIYKIKMGPKSRFFRNTSPGELKVEVTGNIVKAQRGNLKIEVLFSKKPEISKIRDNIVELTFHTRELDIFYRFDNTPFLSYEEMKEKEIKEWDKFREEFIQVSTGDPELDYSFNRSVEDIYSLLAKQEVNGENYRIIQAGSPRFRRFITRDALISSSPLTYTFPEYTRDILKLLINTVGKDTNPQIGEEPGRLPHDILNTKAYKLNPLYDTSDSNALFLIALSEYIKTTGDRSILEDNRSTIESIVNWMIKKIESYGFIPSGKGAWLPETSWMDTDDRVDAELQEMGLTQKIYVKIRRWLGIKNRGTLAPRGVRYPVEMQVQGVKALLEYCELINNPKYCEIAKQLEANIEQDFWTGKIYADTLNRHYNWINRKTSNMLYFLLYSVGKHQENVEKELSKEDMIPKEKHGIRTLSNKHSDYDPKGYQRGGVWPFQSYEFARALLMRNNRLGLEILKQSRTLRDNSNSYLYEVYNGDKPKPLSNTSEIQAWSSSRYIDAIVRGIIGIENLSADYLKIHPFPASNQMKLKNYKFGSGKIDLEYTKEDNTTIIELKHEGMGCLVDIEVPSHKPKKVLYGDYEIEYVYHNGKTAIKNLKIKDGINIIRVIE